VDLIPGLGSVAWASLHGTTESAEDLPRWIGLLRSPDSGVRRHALTELSGAVVHQGSRWQVSAYVVPFLAWLVDDPATADRSELTALLRHVSLGLRDDGDLPFDPGTAFARSDRVTKAQEDMVIEWMYHLEGQVTDDWADLADACAATWDADAYRAAAAHTEAYRRWLADDDPHVASQQRSCWPGSRQPSPRRRRCFPRTTTTSCRPASTSPSPILIYPTPPPSIG
jgi:hypothetical protein